MSKAKQRALSMMANQKQSYFDKIKTRANKITKQQLVKPAFDGDLSVLSEDDLAYLNIFMNMNNFEILEDEGQKQIERRLSLIAMQVTKDVKTRCQYHINYNIEKNLLDLIHSKTNLAIAYSEIMARKNGKHLFKNNFAEVMSSNDLFETVVIALDSESKRIFPVPLLSLTSMFYSIYNDCCQLVKFSVLAKHHYEFAEKHIEDFFKFTEFFINFGFDTFRKGEIYSETAIIIAYRDYLKNAK